MEEQNREQKSIFDKLSETDLMFLLEHDKDKLTEQQILDINTRLNNFREAKEFTNEEITKAKTKVLVKNNKRAGYVDIIIIMLTTWITCLLCLGYIYINIISLG